MKKILSILLVLSSFYSLAQLPNNISQGNANTETYDLGIRGANLGFHWRLSFGDTTAANSYQAGILKNISGFVIRVVSDLWMRNNAATQWIKVNGSGTTGITSISQGWGITNTPNPITSTGTIKVDSNAVKTLIPTQFNPIAGSNVTLTGAYPNITFNASSSGSTNTSIGSGHKFAVNGTNNIKSLYAVYGIILDSLTSGEVGIKVDSSKFATFYQNSLKLNIADTTNKWVDNVTKINDSTIRVFKGAAQTDLLLRGSNNAYWGTKGNAGTVAGTNFIGTTDNVDVMFKRGNNKAGFLGINSTSFGTTALFSNISGNTNTAIGGSALFSNISGSSNTALGASSLYSNSTGYRNASFGWASLTSNTTGYSNASFGTISGNDNTTGHHNIYLGDSTGLGITTGSNNTILGARVIGLSSSLANNIILADGAGNIKQRFYGSDSVTIANTVSSPTSLRDLMLVQDSSTKKVGYRAIPSGGGGGSGTVNTGTQYRLGYYAATGTAISEAAAITGNRALISDVNGVPTHSATTATELAYVSGVTSAIQTQLNLKSPLISPLFTTPRLNSTSTTGHVWTATDAVGNGSFQAAAGGGISGLTTNELVYGNSATTIASLPVATYPSLTELSYVKGVTSNIQTQINAKISGITVGATAITSGTSGNVIYNNAGVVGEYTTTGTGTTLVKSVSPTITTSAIVPLITTGSTMLTLKQTGDTFGESGLLVQNRAGGAGGLFYNNGLDLVDMAFLSNTSNQFNFRYEHRSAELKNSANTAGEFQFLSSAGTAINNTFGVTSSWIGGNLGVGATSPTSTLQVNGSFATAYTSTASSMTATIAHNVIEVTETGQTITLPDATSIGGRFYTIKLTASGSGTVATTGGQLIDGFTTYSLISQYKYVTVQAATTGKWIVIGNN